MAKIRNEISLRDKMTPVFRQILKAMNSTLRAMEQIDKKSNKGAVSKAYQKAAKDIQQANNAVIKFSNSLTSAEQKSNRVAKSVAGWKNPLANAYYAVELLQKGFQAFSGVARISDEFTLTAARLDLINDGAQDTLKLQEMIFQSAERSRGSYTAMAASVSKLGLLAEDAFDSNEELIAFTELMQKSFIIGNASTQEQQSGMYQLTQAMAAGKLQGDEFQSIMRNAPILANAIAKYLGVTKGELKELSSEGLITSDIIKNAMFAAAKDINERFEQMPPTFSSSMQDIKNKALQAFQPIIQKATELLNSEEFAQFIQAVIDGITWIADMAIALANTLSDIYNWFSTNWSTISPILYGIGAAIAAVIAIILVWKTVTVVMTAVQWALNLAMTANPISIIIVAIAALIVIIIAVTVWLIKLWQTNIDFRVEVIRVWNSILAFFDKVPVFFQGIGNGIANIFGGIKVTVLQILEGMVNGAIDIINGMIEAVNKIPGVSIELIDKVTFGTNAAIAEEAARQARNQAYNEAVAAANQKAADREAQLQKDEATWRAEADAKLKAAEEERAKAEELKKSQEFDFTKYMEDAILAGGKLDEVGKINSDVNISDEDIKLLKDVAAKEFSLNYRQITPKMNVTFGDVRETADVNKLMEVIEAMTAEALASSVIFS